jgi:hypothetical protein
MSVLGMASSSCEILYNMTRRASDLRSARVRHCRCSIMLLTLEVSCIQSNIKWDSHINSITTKASKTLGFLRRNINISSTSVKEQAYKPLVQPSLEYACAVYTKENIIQLEQVQRRAAR